jgi:hypothetical protein
VDPGGGRVTRLARVDDPPQRQSPAQSGGPAPGNHDVVLCEIVHLRHAHACPLSCVPGTMFRLSFRNEGRGDRPHPKPYNSTTVASIGTGRITQMSDL